MNNSQTVNFKVDSRISTILGDGYASCERALRELVDNAWDAEARHIEILLPQIITEQPIVVSDDGHGMFTEELRGEYLNIANPRISRKGDRTPTLNRLVKGRRGIGKFAGLVIANMMEVKTCAGGIETTLLIEKKLLLDGNTDIESVPLKIVTRSCDSSLHGTVVTLYDLNPRLSFPQEDKLRELLAYDYGRESTVEIKVNEQKVVNYDVKGESVQKTIPLPDGGSAILSYTIADKPLSGRRSGIILREGNKSIGKMHHWGLEKDEQLSDRLRNRVVGEVIVEPGTVGLTAAGGDVIESDKNFEVISEAIKSSVKEDLSKTHTNEFNLAKGRWQKMMKHRLSKIPEFRRSFVTDRLEQMISKSYKEGEKDERITVLVGLVLDALEMDEYWQVCNEIKSAEKTDVFHFAKALENFGLADLAFIGNQAQKRLDFLAALDKLATEDTTLESQMHSALADNMWIFGPQYGLWRSNVRLKTIINDYVDKCYSGADELNRPDLLLSSSVDDKYLLIEFKRPSTTVGRDAEAQAKKYADTLSGELGISFDILVVGGTVDPKLQPQYTGGPIRFLAYRSLIASAQTQLEWLLEELSK